MHIPPPTPRIMPRSRRNGWEEAWYSRVMTCPCYFQPGFSTPRLGPRGLPGRVAKPTATSSPSGTLPTQPALPRGRRSSGRTLAEDSVHSPAGGRGRGRGLAVTRSGGGEGSPAPLTRGGGTGRRCVSPVQKLKGGPRGAGKERPDSLFYPETDGPAGNDEGRGRPGPCGNRFLRVRAQLRGKAPRRAAWSPAASGASSVSGPASLRLPGPISRHPAPPSARAAPRPWLAGEGSGGPERRGRVVEVAARPTPSVVGLEAPSTCFAFARSLSGSLEVGSEFQKVEVAASATQI